MNKQELTEMVNNAEVAAQTEINLIRRYKDEDSDYQRGRRNAYRDVATWIKDLDKVQKVVVKKFVAEWFEEHKNSLNDSLWDLTIQTNENSQNKDKKLTAFEKWFIDFEYSYEYLIRMKNGYEVEKEQLYQVKIPTVNWDEYSSELVTEYAYLIWDITSDEYKLSASNKDYKSWRASLTESEIKSIDERYWAFAVQVEEVK